MLWVIMLRVCSIGFSACKMAHLLGGKDNKESLNPVGSWGRGVRWWSRSDKGSFFAYKLAHWVYGCLLWTPDLGEGNEKCMRGCLEC